LVMVTVTATLAYSPAPPAIVNVQAPAATGVTANDVPPAGAIVAMPLHEFCWPVAAVDALKMPEKPDWLAVTVCAFAPPAAVNPRLLADRTTGPGGAGVDNGVGLAIATGVVSTEPVQPASANTVKKPATATFFKLTS
jgi:hypothetical protein